MNDEANLMQIYVHLFTFDSARLLFLIQFYKCVIHRLNFNVNNLWPQNSPVTKMSANFDLINE